MKFEKLCELNKSIFSKGIFCPNTKVFFISDESNLLAGFTVMKILANTTKTLHLDEIGLDVYIGKETLEQIRLIGPRLVVTIGEKVTNNVLKRDINIDNKTLYMFEKYSVLPIEEREFNEDSYLIGASNRITEFLTNPITKWSEEEK
jgi:sulfur relay (sulfurtransferase) DsrF/TusC family protein